MPYVSGQTVHDADAHIMELPGTIESHADPKYRDAIAAFLAPKIKAAAIEEARALQQTAEFRDGFEANLLLRKNYQAMGAYDPADRSAARRSASSTSCRASSVMAACSARPC